MENLTQLALVLALCSLAGCATRQTDSFAFLGIPEAESSKQWPVGLVNGEPCRLSDVSTVSESTLAEYQRAKKEGRVFAEETHGGYVYYATKEQRDIRFDNATALVVVIERSRARQPWELPTIRSRRRGGQSGSLLPPSRA